MSHLVSTTLYMQSIIFINDPNDDRYAPLHFYILAWLIVIFY